MQKHRRRHLRYPNLTYVLLSLMVAYWLSHFQLFHSALLHLGNFGYLGALVGGILYVSSFTVATGALILITLAEYMHPVEIAFVAAIGGVIGDFLIFTLIKDDLSSELYDLFVRFMHGRKLIKLFKRPALSWLLPVIGSLIVMSPFPDEFGISLMGISTLSRLKFVLITFLLDFLGVFLLISLIQV